MSGQGRSIYLFSQLNAHIQTIITPFRQNICAKLCDQQFLPASSGDENLDLVPNGQMKLIVGKENTIIEAIIRVLPSFFFQKRVI
ncbi:hypothetical protein A6770_24480 [Nostoc minutum NIES-26]|uniref:Uncharacterized protein n=1 Tax=Nostoc minutum NIES-26 TaxID=1844469 RepID=A0A367QV27_9NOSO|nr:hypothetical protein A6770_24480 [Nostoc minutum NIES-26]